MNQVYIKTIRFFDLRFYIFKNCEFYLDKHQVAIDYITNIFEKKTI